MPLCSVMVVGPGLLVRMIATRSARDSAEEARQTATEMAQHHAATVAGEFAAAYAGGQTIAATFSASREGGAPMSREKANAMLYSALEAGPQCEPAHRHPVRR